MTRPRTLGLVGCPPLFSSCYAFLYSVFYSPGTHSLWFEKNLAKSLVTGTSPRRVIQCRGEGGKDECCRGKARAIRCPGI